MAFKPIEIVINAKDNASAVFGRLEGKVKAVGLAIVGYFGVKAFAGGIQGAAEFEAAMSRVKAATDGTAEEMEGLTKAAQQAGSNTKFTSVEAAGALENLAKAGLSAGDAIKTLPAVLSLAQAGDIELATASEYVTKAVMGMGLAFTDAGRVADVLALGANATNTSVEGLAQALSYAAPVANTLGVSLESTVAIIGKFADAGIDASRAGTALNSIMSQFANPASKFRQELGAAGIVTKDFDEALRLLAASGPKGERAINAVGLEAGPALRALLNQGMGALDELTGKLRAAEGSAAATAKTMSDNLNGSLKGLSSVWDAAVQVLNTPVLPVLRKGVDELNESIRRAIDNGTVAKFGQTLATAFEQGLNYFRAFAANVNFDAVILRLQVFASETQETMQRIGSYATNVGNTVQIAWGVMTAGVSGVMAAIFKVGEAFTGVASNIQSGVALIMDGMSRITFGGMSEMFKVAAEEIRLSAEATWASSQALAEKSQAAFLAMADNAQIARDGWAGLMGEAGKSVPAISEAATQMQALATGIEKVGEASAKAQAQVDSKAVADSKARDAINAMRQEYDQLISSGNLQKAAQQLQAIDKAQQDLVSSSQGAANAAVLVEQAYKDLGLTTNEELNSTANAARSAYDTLAASGTESAQRLAQAWQIMAERVIAANNGLAPKWLQTQAAVKGYEISLDSAGRAVANVEKATAKATKAMAEGFKGVGDAAKNAMNGAGSGGASSGAPNGASIASHFAGANAAYERRQEAERAAAERELDRREQRQAEAEKKQEELGKESRAKEEQEAQRKHEARAAFNALDTGPSGRDLIGEMSGGPLQSIFPKGAMTLQMPTQALGSGAEGGAARGSIATHRHEFVIGGREFSVPTDEGGSNALQQLLAELERGAMTSGGIH